MVCHRHPAAFGASLPRPTGGDAGFQPGNVARPAVSGPPTPYRHGKRPGRYSRKCIFFGFLRTFSPTPCRQPRSLQADCKMFRVTLRHETMPFATKREDSPKDSENSAAKSKNSAAEFQHSAAVSYRLAAKARRTGRGSPPTHHKAGAIHGTLPMII